ncbi:MAG TPA: ribonuclease Z [Thermococcus sp.]|nr:ribonuclease Z [Thermococcus sp.]
MLEVFFLGTGGIMPTRERNVPAIALRYKGEIILFDAGEGTIRQMNTAKLSPMKVEKIFITHFHGDHYLGLAALIQTMNLWDREKPLHIYGPKYTFEFVQHFLQSGFFRPGFDIHVHELGETRLKFGDYEIWSFKVEHGIPALGYVFKEKDRRGKFIPEKLAEYGLSEGPILGKLEREGKIEWNGRVIRLEDVTGPRRRGVKVVYTGDTEPCERVRFFAENADLLIHEATYLNPADRGESYHSTVEEACETARKAKVKLLALFHRAFRYTYEEYLSEASKICREFGVNFVVPRDFDVLTFKSRRWEMRNLLEEGE